MRGRCTRSTTDKTFAGLLTRARKENARYALELPDSTPLVAHSVEAGHDRLGDRCRPPGTPTAVLHRSGVALGTELPRREAQEQLSAYRDPHAEARRQGTRLHPARPERRALHAVEVAEAAEGDAPRLLLPE